MSENPTGISDSKVVAIDDCLYVKFSDYRELEERVQQPKVDLLPILEKIADWNYDSRKLSRSSCNLAEAQAYQRCSDLIRREMGKLK